jgi:trans-2,3-dihydro-3-hydroxyanthranilate isomerase
MMLKFFIVDSFTTKAYSGNPAGVVFHDIPLTASQMQTIAGELHLETAFVSPSQSHNGSLVVAYYTSEQRIPLCGHDTIALGAVLHLKGRVGNVDLSTDIGPVHVQITHDGWISMSQALPQFGHLIAGSVASEALGCDLGDLIQDLPCQVVSTGSYFLYVALRSRECVDNLRPNMMLLADYLVDLPGAPLGCYVWTGLAAGDSPIYSRCFCPGVGLPEDPVTGSASGALGAYLAHHKLLSAGASGEISFETQQGVAMGRAGSVRVTLQTDPSHNITAVHVGGRGQVVARGEILCPD